MNRGKSLGTVQTFLIVIILLGVLFIFSPFSAHAITKPFGGRTLTAISCRNAVIYTIIGPPVGGNYVWTPGTRTYLYGPPSVGRWNLGTAGPPSICVISVNPPIFFFGLTMIMLGTSGGV